MTVTKTTTDNLASKCVVPLSQVAFPRTGKRGVPQQFPRRLYDMLEAEAGQLKVSTVHSQVISWSESGKAFRIFDVVAFSNEILPKYFRTNKFSSFQRNLHLYGFSKARRGPDSDMYAHPNFTRGDPRSLLNLRKISNTSHDEGAERKSTSSLFCGTANIIRSVSPSSPSSSEASASTSESFPSSLIKKNNDFLFIANTPSLSWSIQPMIETKKMPPAAHYSPSSFRMMDAVGCPKSVDRGKLDLLALALERTSAVLCPSD